MEDSRVPLSEGRLGWLARIGLIVPANNCVIEPEFWSIAPEGVTFHAARLVVTGDDEAALIEMTKDLEKAADEIRLSNVAAVAYCCLSSSFVKGIEWDRSLADRIRSRLKRPVITAADAMLRALKLMGIEKVATVTGYKQDLDRKLADFLSDNGITVSSGKGLALDLNEISNASSSMVYEAAKSLDLSDAQGVFVGSTDLHCLDIIQKLEKDIARPVVTVNQALYGFVLNLLGLSEKIVPLGALLQKMREPKSG